MKTIHLLCNAHLDPIWLWQKEEGVAEAISTFRVAADFCEQFDTFVFNHNESLLYEWVETYEPALFERIKKLVKAGKWKIMGGWYVQPDCLMPSGESFIRQMEVGNKYFWEKFGVKVKTGVNFDSFGHTRGLVQILTKGHYDSYVFMRPNGCIPENDFIWRGYDGSEIFGHCIYGAYSSAKGGAVGKIQDAVANCNKENVLLCWGIGNHGGGPSRGDLEAISDYMEQNKNEVRVLHSDCDTYFASVKKDGLRVVDTELGPIHVGCYTSVVRIKQTHRALENELARCEKMLVMAGIVPDKNDMDKVVKSLLLNEFHDVLPGSLVKPSEEAALRHMNFGREILAEYCMKAFFELVKGQPRGKDGEIPVLVFNPNPYPVKQVVEVEFQLENQNWNGDEVTLAHVRNSKGEMIPTQNEQEDSNIPLDWRKRISFVAELAPLCINRFDCELTVEKGIRHPINAYTQDNTHITYQNDRMSVAINKATGLLDVFRVDGKDYVKPGSARIVAYRDSEDAWGMTFDGYYEPLGNFELVSKAEANAFNGYPDTDYENVRVVENGDVRMKIQATFKWGNSFALVTYMIPKEGAYIDMKVKLLSNDACRCYKLAFDTNVENGVYMGQTAFGRQTLWLNERENNYQKWCAVADGDTGIAVLNRGTYGGSFKDGTMNITLLRTAVFSGHPLPPRTTCDDNRWHDHIDMGEREFEYRLTTNMANIDAEAEIYNQRPYALSFFPSGLGEKKEDGFRVDNKNITLSALRHSEHGVIVRLFNTQDAETAATVSAWGKTYNLSFTPYEVKTLLYKNGNLEESEMIIL
ncbi:MAG: alpha-mannosidase [Clostridia bacterium]|nr:alpha-mannosidase [Clostridia bacterium]